MNEVTMEGAVQGQRRQATVLFADMADYTATAEKLGEERVYGLMRRLIAAVADAVNARGGTVHNVSGDGVLALFGAPAALEDAPVKACRAALDIQARIEALADEIDREQGVRPRFRVGLHTGPLVMGAVGDGADMRAAALGDTVNLAARLQAEARPGQVLMSEAIHRLVDGLVESAPEGTRVLKGKSEPQAVFRLVSVEPDRTRFDVEVGRGLGPLVGRGREIETLMGAWDEARDGGLRVVEIVGEAGVGKSRLVHELHERLGEGTPFFRGRCRADARASPFHPFIDVVRSSFRLGGPGSGASVARRLSNGLANLGLAPEGRLPYLLNLLGETSETGEVAGLDPEAIGVRTRAALHDILRERRRLSPMVLLIEDLHWIDAASEDFLRRLGEVDPDLPLLLICTYRPERESPWSGEAAATILNLDHLSREDTIELLKSRMDADHLPDPLVSLVVEKSDGNPLFVEEIVNYLRDRGALGREGAGVAFDPARAAESLPASLANLLMARFDRLEAAQRAVLEAASVIGAGFSAEIVADAAATGPATEAHLAELERQELVFAEGRRGTYRFKHALIQDAVYDSLLSDRRAELHGRVAAAIEGAAAYDTAEAAEALAYHYACAGNAEKAVRFMWLAGERSLQVYSLDAAETWFRGALDLIESTPGWDDDERLVDIVLRLARIHYFRVEFPAIVAMVERYLPVVERLGDAKRQSRFLFEAGYASVFSARQDVGKPLLERALAIAEEIDDDEARAYALEGLLWHYINWEPPTPENRARVKALSQRGAALGQKVGDVWVTSKSLQGLAQFHMLLGESDQSRAGFRKVIEIGRQTNDARPRAMALWGLALLDALLFNQEEAIGSAEESMEIGLCPQDRWIAQCAKGMALVMLDRADEALPVLLPAAERLRQGELHLATMTFDLILGLAYVRHGEMARGVRQIEDTMRQSLAWHSPYAQVYGDLYLGLIYAAMALDEVKPPMAVIRRNILFLLKTLPFAKAKARRHLNAAEETLRAYRMPAQLGIVLVEQARLDHAAKRYDDARRRLSEAREIAETIDEPVLAERVDAALRKLPPPGAA